MELGWGATSSSSSSSSSCRPKMATLLSPCPSSALHFLGGGERTSLRSSTSLEQRRLASATTLCSTSGSASHHAQQQRIPSFWSKSFPQRRRHGKCNFASEGSDLGPGSVAGSVAVKDSMLEVMEWRSVNPKQLQDSRADREDIESQNYALDSAEVELESAGFEKSSGLGGDGASPGKDGGEGEEEMGTERGGWRGLSSGQGIEELGKWRAFLLKRPWRKANSKKKRFRSAASVGSSSPPRAGEKVVPINRDVSLEDLFKSLASRGTSDRSSAVERYFGRELNANKRAGVEVAADRTTATVDGFSTGENNVKGIEANRPARREGRLKINLELDLYRASCLRQEGRLDEAEAILKECIRDWQDDGRAYLELGLLALPLNNDQVNLVDGNMAGRDLNGEKASGLGDIALFPGDYLTYEDAAEESSSGRGTIVPSSPAASKGGERLKINLDLQLYQAKCLKKAGRVDVSETILRKCIRDWPDDGRPYVVLGKLLLEKNRIEDARAVYDTGCQACRGENPYIWQAWAILEERCRDISKARKLFDAATVADNKHVSAWHGWANLELRAGNVKKARSLLNRGLKYCGSNEYIFQTLALLEFRDGKVEEAISLLSKATRYNPKSAPSWLAWALIEWDKNSPDRARQLFQKGVEASPKNRYVWQAWARFESKQGREERARELFQRGRELNPKDVVLLQAFALFEYAYGRPGIARDIFRRAITCDTRHQPVWIYDFIGPMPVRRGAAVDAAEMVNFSFAVLDICELQGWGWMEWKEGNLSVARELYQKAIQVGSRSMDAARAFQAWGVLEDREGDTALARELFKCALKIDSQNVPTWMTWAAMEDREGRPTRADEIRNLFLQQRTEVVEGPWDVDFSDFLAPAIDRIKGVFGWGRRISSVSSEPNSNDDDEPNPSQRESSQGEDGPDVDEKGPSSGLPSDDAEFDVDRFLKEKFPWKYGFHQKQRKSSLPVLVQKPTRF